MNSQMQNLVLSLGAMQVARKIPFDDPDVLLYVRIAYVAVQVIILASYYYVSLKIKEKNDQTTLKYVEASNPMQSNSGGLVTTTVKDYDLQQTSTQLRSAYVGIAMMAVMHIYFKYTQPLFMQALMGLKGIYDAKIVAIHLFGKPAVGDLKRPFKAAGGMFGATGEPATDRAAIEEAEKKVGSKKDE